MIKSVEKYLISTDTNLFLALFVGICHLNLIFIHTQMIKNSMKNI